MYQGVPMDRSCPRFAFRAVCSILGLSFVFASGCAVPQPAGAGMVERRVEPETKRPYWLYLPKDYVAADKAGNLSQRTWPLVVSFHGMKPFDSAAAQVREWEQEADRYGYVVVSPEMDTADVMAEFPRRTRSSTFLADEQAAIKSIDHVFATTRADRKNILATSWSYGGYWAHYMLNRHPDYFTCLAARQSNFSADVLDRNVSDQAKYAPVLIVNTQNDFAVCIDESKAGLNWYKSLGYHNVAWVQIKNLGHERTPDMAADFFGRSAGVQPSTPPAALAQRQAIDGNAEGLALLTGRSGDFARHEGELAAATEKPAAPRAPTRDKPSNSATPPRHTEPTVPANYETAIRNANSSTASGDGAEPPPVPEYLVEARARGARSGAPTVSKPNAKATELAGVTPERSGVQPTPARPRRAPVNIGVSSRVGVEPLLLGYWADCPSDWRSTAHFEWLINGESAGAGVQGQRTLAKAGEYELALIVTTTDGQQYRVSRKVDVLPQVGTVSASQ